MDTNKTKQALSILKAIAYTENGGAPNVAKPKAGKSGEMKSILQFLPATWKDYSKQVTGKDDTPLTPENEMSVGLQKVQNWLESGYSPEQIFSTWNAGKPNAYKNNVKGVNSSGVSYNTPAYVKKAMGYLNQFNSEGNQDSYVAPPYQKGMIPEQTPPTSSPVAESNPGLYQLP